MPCSASRPRPWTGCRFASRHALRTDAGRRPAGEPARHLRLRRDGINDADFAAAVEASRDADLILLVTPAPTPAARRTSICSTGSRRGSPTSRTCGCRRCWRWSTSRFAHAEGRVEPALRLEDRHAAEGGEHPRLRRGGRGAARPRAADVVPVCAREGETFGITTAWCRAVAPPRSRPRRGHPEGVRGGRDARPVGKVFDQLGNVAQAAVSALGELFKKK